MRERGLTLKSGGATAIIWRAWIDRLTNTIRHPDLRTLACQIGIFHIVDGLSFLLMHQAAARDEMPLPTRLVGNTTLNRSRHRSAGLQGNARG